MVARLSFLLILGLLLLSIDITKSHETILTRNKIIKSRWNFYNDNGFLGEMRFRANGTIGLYSNPNEATWSLTDTLNLHHENGTILTKFIFPILDDTGKWKLMGPFSGIIGWKHYLFEI